MNNTSRAQVVTPAEWEAARLRLLAKELPRAHPATTESVDHAHHD
jgi:hypothetical protein